MKTPVVYISCPLSIPQSGIDRVVKKINEMHSTTVVTYYHRGTAYNQEEYDVHIKSVDAFVVILPNFAWSMSESQLTAGVKRELKLAWYNSIPIFLAYEMQAGVIQIYSAHSRNRTVLYQNGAKYEECEIKGISGSFNALKDHLELKAKNYKEMAAPTKPPEPVKKPWYDLDNNGSKEIDEIFGGQKVNTLAATKADLERYSHSIPSIRDHANRLFATTNYTSEQFHDAMRQHIAGVKKEIADRESEAIAKVQRQSEKVQKFAEAYGAKSLKASTDSMYSSHIEQIKQLYIAGWNASSICGKLGVNYSFVAEVINKNRGKLGWCRTNINQIAQTGTDFHKVMEEAYAQNVARWREHALNLEREIWQGTATPQKGYIHNEVYRIGSMLTHADGSTEVIWHDNPDCIDTRLVMFF